jgi:hypothetical protein
MAEPSRRSYQAFGLIYQDWQKERSQLTGCQQDSSLPRSAVRRPPK